MAENEYPALPEASITIHSAGFRVASGKQQQADGSAKEIRVLILNVGSVQVELPLPVEAARSLGQALTGGVEIATEIPKSEQP